jgi:hypothetical protein
MPTTEVAEMVDVNPARERRLKQLGQETGDLAAACGPARGGNFESRSDSHLILHSRSRP